MENPNNGSLCNVGCLLVVDQCEGLPDGRLIIQCNALQRFKIISREMVDGYWYAEIEYLHDVLPTTNEELSEMQALIDTVREMAAKASVKNTLAA
jgi:Lon protease-like protein